MIESEFPKSLLPLYLRKNMNTSVESANFTFHPY